MEAIRGSKLAIVYLNLGNNEISHMGVEHMCASLLNGAGRGLVHLNLSN